MNLPLYQQYAKDEDGPDGISIRITAYNRGPDPADLHIIPQLWFRNTWSWPKDEPVRPKMAETAEGTIQVDHETLGRTHLYCSPSPAPAAPADGGVVLVDGPSVHPELLFTENDTNFEVSLFLPSRAWFRGGGGERSRRTRADFDASSFRFLFSDSTEEPTSPNTSRTPSMTTSFLPIDLPSPSLPSKRRRRLLEPPRRRRKRTRRTMERPLLEDLRLLVSSSTPTRREPSPPPTTPSFRFLLEEVASSLG